MSQSPQPILQTQGVLGDMFARMFREQFPAIMDKHGDKKVWMLVTTRLMHLGEESQRSGSYFKASRDGSEPVFTWKASGVFHGIVRQFRLDFLRHLGPEEMRCRVFLTIYPGEQTPNFSEVLLAYPMKPEHNPAARMKLNVQSGTGGRDSISFASMPWAIPAPGSRPAGAAPDARLDPPITARIIDAASKDDEGDSTALMRSADQTLVSPDRSDDWLPLNRVALSVDDEAEDKAAPEPAAEAKPAEKDGGHAPEAEGFKPREPVFFMDSDTAYRPSGTPYIEPGASEPAMETMEVPTQPAASPSAAPIPKSPLTGKNPRNLPGNLYQEFFGFERMPFNNTPDTTFFFPTDKHQEALSRLLYAISEKKGFVMISGEIGSGKSTLCRALLTQLPRNVKVALITHTHLDATQIIRAIAEDFGLETNGCDRYEVHQMLNEYLIDQLADDATVCIIIDEAQNLSPETLEEVRMISNLETESEKLVQLILLGQPELRDKIKLPVMKQLRQRISVQYHLVPLTRDETVEYIQHRLKVANPTESINFKRSAMVEAFRYSGGTPRLINTICDNALVTTFTRGKRVVTASLVREAAEDLDLEPQVGGIAQFFKSW